MLIHKIWWYLKRWGRKTRYFTEYAFARMPLKIKLRMYWGEILKTFQIIGTWECPYYDGEWHCVYKTKSEWAKECQEETEFLERNP